MLKFRAGCITYFCHQFVQSLWSYVVFFEEDCVKMTHNGVTSSLTKLLHWILILGHLENNSGLEHLEILRLLFKEINNNNNYFRLILSCSCRGRPTALSGNKTRKQYDLLLDWWCKHKMLCSISSKFRMLSGTNNLLMKIG